MTKRILIVLLCIGISYLAASFIAWDFNPERWKDIGRALFGLYSVAALVLAIVIPKDGIV